MDYDAGTSDFLTLASKNKGLRAMTKCFMVCGVLGQCSLARLQAFETNGRKDDKSETSDKWFTFYLYDIETADAAAFCVTVCLVVVLGTFIYTRQRD